MPAPLQQNEPRAEGSRRRWLLLGVVLTAMALAGVCVDNLVDRARLRAAHGRVEVGMTKDEVRTLLGDPAPSGSKDHWYYPCSTFLTHEVFVVRFSPTGLVSEVDHDSFP